MRLSLSRACELKGWDVKTLSERTGIHQATIYRLLKGQKPSYETRETLERVLEAPLVFGVPGDQRDQERRQQKPGRRVSNGTPGQHDRRAGDRRRGGS